MIVLEDEQVMNWSDEQPFFTFELPYFHIIVFEGGNLPQLLHDMMGDLVLPYKKVVERNDPLFAALQEQIDREHPEGKKIDCIILPLRYTKVFEA